MKYLIVNKISYFKANKKIRKAHIKDKAINTLSL